jgi:hypothetical protein
MAKNLVENMSNKDRELRITGVGNSLHTDLKNIAGHLGVSMSDMLKTKIADVVKEYPAHYRQPVDKS